MKNNKTAGADQLSSEPLEYGEALSRALHCVITKIWEVEVYKKGDKLDYGNY